MSLADTIAMYRMGVEMDRLNGAMSIVGGDNGVSTIYDACAAYMAAAGPLPLVAAEPWRERDLEYIARMTRHRSEQEREALWLRWIRGERLDDIGRSIGVPRADLVPARTCW